MLGSMRFRKIAPGPRHASSLSLAKVAVAQASGWVSLSKAGPSSQPSHDFPEVTPATASSPGHHTGYLQRDKARYSRGQTPHVARRGLCGSTLCYSWQFMEGSDEFLIHPWAKYIRRSIPDHIPGSVFHNLSFICLQPRSAQARFLRGRDHFQ